jgi:hypothetical protein
MKIKRMSLVASNAYYNENNMIYFDFSDFVTDSSETNRYQNLCSELKNKKLIGRLLFRIFFEFQEEETIKKNLSTINTLRKYILDENTFFSFLFTLLKNPFVSDYYYYQIKSRSCYMNHII